MLWATSASSAWMPLAAAVAVAWIAFRLHRKLTALRRSGSSVASPAATRRTQGPTRDAPPGDARCAGSPTLRDAPSQLAAWEVAMHETARQLKAELDTRIALAQQWIRATDEAIARLRAELARLEAATTSRDNGAAAYADSAPGV